MREHSSGSVYNDGIGYSGFWGEEMGGGIVGMGAKTK